MTAAEMDIIIGAEVTGAVNGLKQVNAQLVKTEQTATKVSGKVGKDFTGLNRVLQDLPFGFIAIQNNLTQLVPAAGGLGVAFAVITSALTFAQVGLSNWTRGLKAAKEETDEVSKSVAGAKTELTKVSALLSVAKDLNESTATRTNAIKELQKEYPGYLGNLTLENVNSQETARAVDMLAGALTRKAKVQAISNLLTKANETLLKAENAQVFESLNVVNSFIAKLTKGKGIIGFSALNQDAVASAKAIKEAGDEVKVLEGKLNALVEAQAEGNDWELIKPTTPKKIKDVSDELEKLRNHFPFFQQLFTTLDLSKLNIKPVGGLIDTESMRKNFEDSLKIVAEFSKMLQDNIKGALVGIGEALGNAISGKGNIFSSFLNVIGSSLTQLGAYVIASVELLATVKKAFITALSGTPFFGIGVGIGLIALGTVLKNIPKFATGGVVTSPTLALVGEQGPERITPLGYEGNASNAMAGTVEFQISGQVLRGILRRTDNANYYTN